MGLTSQLKSAEAVMGEKETAVIDIQRRYGLRQIQGVMMRWQDSARARVVLLWRSNQVSEGVESRVMCP